MGGDNPGALAEGLTVGHVAHLVDVDGESTEHDDQGGGENSLDERSGENTGVLGAWGTVHDRGVNGLNAKGLRWWAVHKNVCKNELAKRVKPKYTQGQETH